MKIPSLLTNFLDSADLTLNGTNPYDPKILDERAIKAFMTKGSVGIGEAYMNKWWDVEDLSTMFKKILSKQKNITEFIKKYWISSLTLYLKFKFFNYQNITHAKKVGTTHYDLGNQFFQYMLDPYMTYTCAYFKDTNDLNEAQIKKMDLICKKVHLKPGMKVLDIGCGWGGMALYAAKYYGAEVVGVTISSEQAKLAQERVKDYPIEIRVQDYRQLPLDEQYDAIVSLGMFEHVGHKNYDEFFTVAKRHLKPEGLFLLHTIGSLDQHPIPDPWFEKYIFPNSVLPNASLISKAFTDKFVMEDWQNFGFDYSRTLAAWFKNFYKAWPEIKDQYNETFYRMIKYYLIVMEAFFSSRTTQLWQIVLSPHGVTGRYDAPR